MALNMARLNNLTGKEWIKFTKSWFVVKVRRGSVIVSFMMGAFLFHERNLKSKAVDLVLVLLGLLFLYLGTVCND